MVEIRERINSHDTDTINIAHFLCRHTRQRSDGRRVQAADLYNAYVYYCVKNKLPPCTRALFGQRVGGKHFRVRSIKSNNVYWIGLELINLDGMSRADWLRIEIENLIERGAKLPEIILTLSTIKFPESEGDGS